eukprot:2447979-Lingulodinium_polyedra.AAC.1
MRGHRLPHRHAAGARRLPPSAQREHSVELRAVHDPRLAGPCRGHVWESGGGPLGDLLYNLVQAR